MLLFSPFLFAVCALQAANGFRTAFPRAGSVQQGHPARVSSFLEASKSDDSAPNVQPLSNNILVKVLDPPTKTSAGIYIPEAAKKRPTEGTVVATGPGRTNLETGHTAKMATVAGDSVVYGKYDGSEFKLGGENHQIVRDDDVLLKFRGGSRPMLSNAECVHDRVLVRPARKSNSTSSGILTVYSNENSQSSASEEGVVVKTGPGLETATGKVIAMPVTSGDHVRYRKYHAEELKLDGEDFVVVRASDLLAKW
jgi:chaperonin GroES